MDIRTEVRRISNFCSTSHGFLRDNKPCHRAEFILEKSSLSIFSLLSLNVSFAPFSTRLVKLSTSPSISRFILRNIASFLFFIYVSFTQMIQFPLSSFVEIIQSRIIIARLELLAAKEISNLVACLKKRLFTLTTILAFQLYHFSFFYRCSWGAPIIVVKIKIISLTFCR